MRSRSIRRLVVVVFAVFLIGLFLVDSTAQRRRRRNRTRRPSAPRITNPPIYQPGDETNTNSNTSGSESGSGTNANEDPEAMKKTIHDLSSQVNQLSNKINQMEQSQRTLVDLERLSRAEQRSADLWKQLRDVEAQQADLQSRAEEVDYALKPENIERAVAGYGSTRPEEVRDQRRRQLENEKVRVQKQLEQLAANHARLETSIAAADADIERLRKRLDAADQAALENSRTAKQSERAAPAATPSPSPFR